MKFIPTGTRHGQYETLDDIKYEPDQGKPRNSPSYYETAKKAKNTKKSSF